MTDIKEILEKFGTDEVVITLDVAIGLFEAGYKILEILRENGEMSPTDLLVILEEQENAKSNARQYAIAKLKDIKE